MSSMRNAVHRRQHRERGQPEGREKWGILEKHKDYSLRARDYNLKKAKLQRLREKARDRNPDEFAFGMLSERTKTQGRHGARENSALSHDAVKLLKTQDAGYLRVIGERARRELERFEADVKLQEGMQAVLIGHLHHPDSETKKGRKLIFVESLEEQQEIGRKQAANGDQGQGQDVEAAEEEEGGKDSSEQQQHREERSTPNKEKKKSSKELETERRGFIEMRAARKLKKRAAQVRLNKLSALRRRHTDITTAERELDRERGQMTNSIGGVNKYGLKWKIRERKK